MSSGGDKSKMHGVAGLQMHLMHTQGSVDTRMHTHKDARMHVYKGVHKGTHKRTHTRMHIQGCIHTRMQGHT